MASGWRGGGGFPKAVRRRVLAERGWCVVCGSTEGLEVDHRVGGAEGLAAGWSLEELQDESIAQVMCRAHHAERTKAQAAAGRRRQVAERKAAAKRPAERHPGLIGNG